MIRKRREPYELKFTAETFISDIKINGYCYIRSKVVVDEIIRINPNMFAEYLGEENLYIVRYNKPKKEIDHERDSLGRFVSKDK